MLPMYPIHLTRNTNYIHLADFLPCCLETFLIDPRVSCEDKGQDVACARIRAGRLGRSAQCIQERWGAIDRGVIDLKMIALVAVCTQFNFEVFDGQFDFLSYGNSDRIFLLVQVVRVVFWVVW